MKANEAPEKIYVEIHHPFSNEYTEMVAFEHGDGIEYTRTDAFIKKAEEFIYSALNNGIMGTANIEDFMRLFQKYIKGE